MDETTLQLWQVLGAFGGTLAIVALTLWVSKHTLLQAWDLWLTLRGYRTSVLASLDEADDPVIARLSQLTGLPAVAWVAFLPAFLRAVADGLDQALDIGTEPPQVEGEAGSVPG